MEVNKSLEKLFTEKQKPLLGEWQELFSLSNTPPPESLEIGTVIMPTGDWLDRAPSALNFFKDRFSKQNFPPHLVVSGKHSHPGLEKKRGGAGANKVVRAFGIFGQLTREMKERLIAEAESTNTKKQAENIYELLLLGTIREPLAIVVSAYHLPRFYSTFVRTILANEKQLKTRLYSIPVFGNWEGEIPKEPRGKRYEQIVPEMEKIHRYRSQGDIATEAELTYYTDWLRRKT